VCWHCCSYRLDLVSNSFVGEGAMGRVDLKVLLKKKFGEGGEGEARYGDRY
jgi:hypothetical protein